jgi:hypothetical protein
MYLVVGHKKSTVSYKQDWREYVQIKFCHHGTKHTLSQGYLSNDQQPTQTSCSSTHDTIIQIFKQKLNHQPHKKT